MGGEWDDLADALVRIGCLMALIVAVLALTTYCIVR